MKTKKMTKAQMRVAVARDVIKQADSYELGGMQYLAPVKGYWDCTLGGKELQAEIPKIMDGCRVCAKGAIVLSHIKLFDGYDRLPLYTYAEIEAQNIWGKRLADLIERYYEGMHEGAAYKFEYPDPGERLKAIMRNVIRNKGDFKPPKERKSAHI